MRYLFVSDIHGCYDKLIKALTDAGFDAQNDTLVSIGDPFDRGSQNKEVLDFLLKTPHHILLWGNHDWRLRELVFGEDYMAGYDYQNGMVATFLSLTGTTDESALIRLLYNEQLMQYFRECYVAIEFKDLIVTHGWLPVKELDWNRCELYHAVQPDGTVGDWRKAKRYDWTEALWANTDKMITRKLYPEKTMLIGHWHAWRLAEKFGEKRQKNKHDPKTYIDCNTFIYDYRGERKFIAIDGCANWPYGGKVNVFEYITDEVPIFYSLKK